ncbi:MAG TPA: glycoside hydrolase family 3 N-terminal domain-containing protein [bacterium]|nr:glycoside hydrolase family 3 N-terminal domain-containing protein [bacterium]HPR88041.1 glycoside hydrolase family 3 N-terminal domain-containing protein [bacterium]
MSKSHSFLYLVTLTCLLFFTLSASAQTYLDPNAAIADRVEDLLGRMTLAEKIGQMTQADRGGLANEVDIAGYNLGSVLSGGGSAPENNSPAGWAEMYDRMQSQALSTRLAIPLLYGIDAVHGHNNVKGAVIFPHNIGLGASRDTALVRQAAEIAALEVAGTGIDWTFAPCVAVVRDERWGRTYEAFGETAELAEMMGVAQVRGFQGDTLGRRDRILACAKHYLGDGGTSGGVNEGNTLCDEATLRALYLPAYARAIAAGAGTIMPSYSSWNGAKMHSNRYLLTTVLKGELGFKGFVVSDYDGIKRLPGNTYHAQIVAAVNAGMDMGMVPDSYRDFIRELAAAVNAKEVTMERIDDAVRRILTIKFRMGLFEDASTDPALTAAIGSAAHREVARACVRESLVLLAKKDGILPLSRSARRIHVAGNGADNLGNQCGGWTISWQGSSGDVTDGTTLLEALRAEAPAVQFTYSLDGSGAAGADLGIAVIGETPYAESQGDKDDLQLAAKIVEPVRALKKAGLKTVVLLYSGRPMLIDSILPWADVLIAAWLPGTEGRGITDVLFGSYPPSGKLPHSWPRAMADIPINWGDNPYRPLYPYGYGITRLADSNPGSAPEFYAAAVNAAGDSVLVGFNKAMADPATSTPAEWTVLVNWGVSGVMGIARDPKDPTLLRLALDRAVVKHDVIQVVYNGATVHSSDGGQLAPFAAQPVYNLRDDVAGKDPVPGRVQAEDYVQMQGVQTETTSDTGGGENVGYIDTGDYLVYQVEVTAPGSYRMDFRIAAESKSGQIKVIDGSSLLATLDLPVTGGWQTWQNASTTAALTAGSHTLRIQASRGGFNLNYIDFTLTTGVEARRESALDGFRLAGAYPNPFNASTSILCLLPASRPSERLQLLITDALGREVRRYEALPAGSEHRFQWDGRDGAGLTMPSGLYFFTARSGAEKASGKMLLLR